MEYKAGVISQYTGMFVGLIIFVILVFILVILAHKHPPDNQSNQTLINQTTTISPITEEMGKYQPLDQIIN